MKNLFIIVLFTLSSFACSSKNSRLQANIRIEKKADSLYFSIGSACNIKLEFTGGGNANALINGKARSGKIRKNKESEGYYDFVEKNAVAFMFAFEDNRLLIVNQQYQFGCEPAKVLELDRLTNDKAIIQKFTLSFNDKGYLWDDVAAVNDKAYYLDELKFHEASAFILEEVIKKQPERAVAYINLGDALWQLNKKKEAREAYNTYTQLITKQKKDQKKIPQRVYDRLKQ